MEKNRTKKESLVLDNAAQIRALADPLRYRVFELLTVEPRTAKQTAGLMGTKPTRLYHHFGVLEKAGLIRKVKTRRKRGTTEKYYEAVAKTIAFAPDILGDKVKPVSSLTSATFQTTLEEIAAVERAASDASKEPQVLMGRLKFRTTEAKAKKLQTKLEAWLKMCQEASDSNGDAEYAVMVACYQVAPSDRTERDQKDQENEE